MTRHKVVEAQVYSPWAFGLHLSLRRTKFEKHCGHLTLRLSF